MPIKTWLKILAPETSLVFLISLNRGIKISAIISRPIAATGKTIRYGGQTTHW
jgi:hypothetical protein